MVEKRSKLIIAFEWLCVIMGLTSQFLIASKHPSLGFSLSIITGLLFLVYNYITKQYGMLLMTLVNLGISIYGVINWR